MSRLLFVSPSAYTLSGLAVWLDYLLPGLAEYGWTPVLGLVQGRYHDPESYTALHRWPRYVTITNPTGSREGRTRSLVETIRRVDPAVVVSVNIPDAIYAAARFRRRNASYIKSVIAIHGFEPCIFGDVINLGQALDGVVCTNRLGCRLGQELTGLDPQRIHYAPCGTQLVPPRREDAREPTLRVAWVGRFNDKQKRVYDFAHIVEATLQRERGMEFLLVGAGEEETSIRDWISRKNLGDKVKITEFAQEDLREQVYQHVDVLLCTSYWETGPLVLWEAMASEVAVVCSKYIGSGQESALQDGHNALLYPTGDCEAASKCLLKLTDPDLRRGIARNGKELIQSRYSWAASVEAWDRVFRRILEAAEKENNSTALPPTKPTGRLDDLLGVGLGESVRRILGIRFQHTSPGGEWPHCYGNEGLKWRPFWDLAIDLDAVRPDGSRYRNETECATLQNMSEFGAELAANRPGKSRLI